MIDPNTITNYNRSEEELEEFLMFAILVEGKTAKTQAEKLNQFLSRSMHENSGKPFQHIQHLLEWGWLDLRMREFKLGQYKRIGHAFTEILKFKGRLKSVTLEELESVKGIGSKTARFFLLHSRKDVKCAVLDTHILKWLGTLGHKVPKSTPAKKTYSVLEKIFLNIAETRKISPADLDLMIWKSYANA